MKRNKKNVASIVPYDYFVVCNDLQKNRIGKRTFHLPTNQMMTYMCSHTCVQNYICSNLREEDIFFSCDFGLIVI